MSRVMAALVDVARHFRSALGVRLPGEFRLDLDSFLPLLRPGLPVFRALGVRGELEN